MSTKLTHRDKVLIYVMVIALLIFGFVMLLILPQMERASALDAEIAALETEKTPIEIAVAGLPTMRQAVDTAQENLATALTAFYPNMQNYEIDKMLTNLFIGSYNLQVDSFDVAAAPKQEMVPVYSAGGLVTTTQPTQTVEGEEVPATPVEITPEMVPLLTSQVTLMVTGAEENFRRLVDDLFLDYPSIRVRGYSMGAESVNEQGQRVMTIHLDLYMQRPAA